MAKVSGPLFSLHASGNVGKAIIFTTSKGVKICKGFFKSLDRKNPGQVEERFYFLTAVGNWNNLSVEEKAVYDAFATGKKMTGYNYFIKLRIEEQILEANRAIYNQSYYNQRTYAPNGVG